ncbi:MAG: cytochrome c maturation protein CcmE [Phycisphaerae bacterium]|jgi:cytochrome c-type biogenesis protein CcmE|nr:cytochrome c maturation protein CcmE [Phycisphaerae bacterium]
MTNVRLKLTVGGVLLAVFIGYLGYAGIAAGSSYYLSVDSYMSSQEYHSERVRLHGKVGREGLSLESGGAGARFVLLGDASQIAVRYEGVVPDLFKVGGEVVVMGRMGKDDVFEAAELMTKCASKYDEMKNEGKKRP